MRQGLDVLDEASGDAKGQAAAQQGRVLVGQVQGLRKASGRRRGALIKGRRRGLLCILWKMYFMEDG